MNQHEIILHYTKSKKNTVTPIEKDCFVCIVETPKTKKAIFKINELDRSSFRDFVIISNTCNINKIVVYCEYAYYEAEDLQIILDRPEERYEH